MLSRTKMVPTPAHHCLNSIGHVAAVLNETPAFVWELIKDRRLGHIRLDSGAVRVSDAQIAEYIRSDSTDSK
jgi:hypothetical protein